MGRKRVLMQLIGHLGQSRARLPRARGTPARSRRGVGFGARRHAPQSAERPLRRVAFPVRPTPEWFAVDLLENAGAAGASREDLAVGLARAVRRGALDRQGLRDAARRFGTRRTQNVVDRAVERGSTERA